MATFARARRGNPEVLHAGAEQVLAIPNFGDFPSLDDAHSYAQGLIDGGSYLNAGVVCQPSLDGGDGHHWVVPDVEAARVELGVDAPAPSYEAPSEILDAEFVDIVENPAYDDAAYQTIKASVLRASGRMSMDDTSHRLLERFLRTYPDIGSAHAADIGTITQAISGLERDGKYHPRALAEALQYASNDSEFGPVEYLQFLVAHAGEKDQHGRPKYWGGERAREILRAMGHSTPSVEENPRGRLGIKGTRKLTLKIEKYLFADRGNEHTVKHPGDKVTVSWSPGIGSATIYAENYYRDKMLSAVVDAKDVHDTFKSWPKEWETTETQGQQNPVAPRRFPTAFSAKKYAKRLLNELGENWDPIKLTKEMARAAGASAKAGWYVMKREPAGLLANPWNLPTASQRSAKYRQLPTYQAGYVMGMKDRRAGKEAISETEMYAIADRMFPHTTPAYRALPEKSFRDGYWHGYDSIAGPKGRLPNPGQGAFKRCVKAVEARGGAYDASAVCAAAGRRKYGEQRFQEMAARGKRLAARGRHNPESDASALYEDFHGRPPAEDVEVHYDVHEHEHLAGLGDLCQLKVITIYGADAIINVAPTKGKETPDPSNLPKEERVILASSEDGRQLYLVGGDQSLDLAALGFKDADMHDNVLVGVLYELTYQTEKSFHQFELTDYFHRLGEDTGVEPVLLYDRRSELLSVAGGHYKIEKPGIIN